MADRNRPVRWDIGHRLWVSKGRARHRHYERLFALTFLGALLAFATLDFMFGPLFIRPT